MPRRGRLDFPGALHHVVVRGIARGRIFGAPTDYRHFVEHLARLIVETKTRCYAWSLLPNHAHLLLATGRVKLGTVMQQLLTEHAIYYNHRHQRVGHLFQNRYKSILCERDPYLLQLVRYIHLNPLRAGLVRSLEGLRSYPWCGHGVLMGERKAVWQDADFVLQYYSNRAALARAKYEAFVRQGMKEGRREDLQGGGLIRSAGGIVELMQEARAGVRSRGDERVLGSGGFVNTVLRESEKKELDQSRLRREINPEAVIAKAAEMAKIKPEEVRVHGKRPEQCKARRLACKWLVEDLGLKEVEVGRLLGITQPSVSHNVARGRILEKEMRTNLRRIL